MLIILKLIGLLTILSKNLQPFTNKTVSGDIRIFEAEKLIVINSFSTRGAK